ncbi:MAG: ATP-binding protein [Actinomycetota bacterium]
MARLRSRVYPAEPRVLGDVRGWVGGCAGEAGLPEVGIADLVLAVTEACSNAIRHSGSREFAVTVEELADGVEVEVVDDGLFRNRMPVLEITGGMGLPLMTALVDTITVDEGRPDDPGTVVRLTKNRPPSHVRQRDRAMSG